MFCKNRRQALISIILPMALNQTYCQNSQDDKLCIF